MSSELRRARAEGCLSDLVLDRLVMGEVAPSTAGDHLRGCEPCRARLEDLRAEAGQGQVVELASRRRRRWPVVVAAAGLVAAAAALLLLVRPRDPGGVVAKGQGGLAMYVRGADGQVARWREGAVHPGDALRFAVTGHGTRFVAVLARDGAGQVSVYFPPGDRAAPVDLDGETPLPGSVTLDQVIGRERAVVLVCASPVHLEPLRAAFEHAGDLPAPPGCERQVLAYDKVSR
jgi:hypothetical protein